MNRFRHAGPRFAPAAALFTLAMLTILAAAQTGQSPAQQTAKVNIILTGGLWQSFYPAISNPTGSKDALKEQLSALSKSQSDAMFLDSGGFSGMTMLTETDYTHGVLAMFKEHQFNAVNLGRQESLMASIELDMLLKRAEKAGVAGFVASFQTPETDYTPRWQTFVETTRNGKTFVIGGIADDNQHTMFLKSDPIFTRLDHADYTRQLLTAAREKGAFPILLADAAPSTVNALAQSVEGLPLILSAAPTSADNVRTINGTLIYERPLNSAAAVITLEAGWPAFSAEITDHKLVTLSETPKGDEPAYWPAALPGAAAMPPVNRPDIGLPLDNEAWLKTLGLKSDSLDLNMLSGGVVNQFPLGNKMVHYYNVAKADDSGNVRLVYLRHQLPHPYPNIYFLVVADQKGKIEQLYFPFGVILGSRPTRLADWAQSMTGDDAAALERKLASQELEFFQVLIMTDVYHTLKVLEAGAI